VEEQAKDFDFQIGSIEVWNSFQRVLFFGGKRERETNVFDIKEPAACEHQ
jgi:hypothetical protein